MKMMDSIQRGVLAVALTAGLLGGCASTDDPQLAASEEQEGLFGPDNDPLEFVNRFTFAFNDAVDVALLQPAAATYRFLLPEPVRDGVRNAFRNLNAPVIFANDLMQGEWERAKTTFVRFVINSTIGVAGIFDVADDMGYVYHDEDFGQTLGAWGLGEGFYLVLPLIGPSSARDAVGIVVDSYIDPWPYVLDAATGLSDDTIINMMIGRSAIRGIDLRARNIETIENIKKDAIDYYARLRSYYRQNREKQIMNGADEEIPLPTLSEEEWAPPTTSDTTDTSTQSSTVTQ